MKPEPNAEGLRWVRQAGHDLSDAEYSLDGCRYALACVLCQQAADKTPKGYLYTCGADQVLGHSVADLMSECAAPDRDFGALRPNAALLDHYDVPTRYPNSLPGGIPTEAFDDSDARRALTLTAAVIRLVRGKIGEANGGHRWTSR